MATFTSVGFFQLTEEIQVDFNRQHRRLLRLQLKAFQRKQRRMLRFPQQSPSHRQVLIPRRLPQQAPSHRQVLIPSHRNVLVAVLMVVRERAVMVQAPSQPREMLLMALPSR